MSGPALALFLARAVDSLQTTVCCIVPTDEQVETLRSDFSLFSSISASVYPSFEIPPYGLLSPDPTTSGLRLSALYRLAEKKNPGVVIVSSEALLRRVLPKQVLLDRCELLISGEEIEREELLSFLVVNGYEPCDMVKNVGEFSVRGGIVDIFPPPVSGELFPLRLDFFGDTIESMRLFDPVSQRSLSAVEETVLLPANDILFPLVDKEKQWHDWLAKETNRFFWDEEERQFLCSQLESRSRFVGIEFYLPLLYNYQYKLHSFFDYLPSDTLLVYDDSVGCKQQSDLVWERIENNYKEARAANLAVLPPEMLFVTPAEEKEQLASCKRVDVGQFTTLDSGVRQIEINCGNHDLLAQEIEIERRKRGLLAPLVDRLHKWKERGDKILLTCLSQRQQTHLAELFSSHDLESVSLEPPVKPSDLSPSIIHLSLHKLSKGFDLKDERLHILSGAELFGAKKISASSSAGKQKTAARPVAVDSLAPGDIVVHREHGLGRFCGLVNMDLSGQISDFIQIEYLGGDKLYVPVDRLHWVSPYQGVCEKEPRLDKLGSSRWQTTKKKVRDAVLEVAHELLEIHAKRELRRGHQFNPPGPMYQSLEESFPYEETPDQLGAINDVLADMTSSKPMDRLVCGDVGYGKTEVAARAAFKAIEDGFQVAILVPTTVLAEQHGSSFRERFSKFPVKVACLNRFRSSSQQRQIKEGLASGEINMVVGTHALLGKSVSFKNLGLLVIDEEHRFGVSHKEKIKKIKQEVDVLTLTATPIPRTLQMSLLGIRDLSVISTPPRQRRAVKTFLSRRDNLVIKEAVLKELQRNGQIFFIHNRVRTIQRVAEELAELVPQARIGIGHGQMATSQIEEVMVKFINHEIDILVCTTIVESGLDISNANTIIINRADTFGLADIYQLRGRVGRSGRQAFAYLLVPSLKKLGQDAKKRLQALMDASGLGSGFKLAMNDLQIRGGGNLLGVSQSGHIAAVGYDLYLELLQSTVEELKQEASGQAGKPLIDPEINLKISTYIPEDYIPSTAQRYHAYRRLALSGNEDPEMLADLLDELEDRYGALPPETINLSRVIGLKHLLRRFSIIKLEQANSTFVFSFSEYTDLPPEKLLVFMEKENKKLEKKRLACKLTPDQRLVVPVLDLDEPIAAVEAILKRLEKV